MTIGCLFFLKNNINLFFQRRLLLLQRSWLRNATTSLRAARSLARDGCHGNQIFSFILLFPFCHVVRHAFALMRAPIDVQQHHHTAPAGNIVVFLSLSLSHIRRKTASVEEKAINVDATSPTSVANAIRHSTDVVRRVDLRRGQVLIFILLLLQSIDLNKYFEFF